MNPQSMSEWLVTLALPERVKALNLVSYKLTLYARDCQGQDSVAKKKLLGINELQHKLVSQIGHYLNNDESRAYPVDVFSSALFQTGQYYDITSVLEGALKSVQGKK
jgi:hypothetical protein